MSQKSKARQRKERDRRSLHEVLAAVVRAQDKYIKLLTDENQSLVPIAFAHGWRCQNPELGARARRQISKLKQAANDPSSGTAADGNA